MAADGSECFAADAALRRELSAAGFSVSMPTPTNAAHLTRNSSEQRGSATKTSGMSASVHADSEVAAAKMSDGENGDHIGFCDYNIRCVCVHALLASAHTALRGGSTG